MVGIAGELGVGGGGGGEARLDHAVVRFALEDELEGLVVAVGLAGEPVAEVGAVEHIAGAVLHGDHLQFVVGAGGIAGAGVVVERGGAVGDPASRAGLVGEVDLGDQAGVHAAGDIGERALGQRGDGVLRDGFFQRGDATGPVPGFGFEQHIAGGVFDLVEGALLQRGVGGREVEKLVRGAVGSGEDQQAVAGIGD